MNDRGGNSAGCFDIEEWADTTELTNVKVAGLGKSSYLVRERQVLIKDEAEIASRVGGAERAVLYHLGELLFESHEKKFSFKGVES